MAALLVGALGTQAQAAGDPVKGKASFKMCAVCHKIDKSGTSTMGPNLYGIVGRPIGKLTGFRFSPAFANAKGKWTTAALDAFLAAPSKSFPGNRMIYAGMKNAADRQNVIAYMQAQSK